MVADPLPGECHVKALMQPIYRLGEWNEGAFIGNLASDCYNDL